LIGFSLMTLALAADVKGLTPTPTPKIRSEQSLDPWLWAI